MTADLFTQAVLPLFETHRASFLEQARSAAVQIAGRQGHVTVDDIREVCPPPPDVDGRVMGAILKQRDFELVGYKKSSRSTCHNRAIAIFRLRSAS